MGGALHVAEPGHAHAVGGDDGRRQRADHPVDAMELRQDRGGDLIQVRPFDLDEHVPVAHDREGLPETGASGELRQHGWHLAGRHLQVDVGVHQFSTPTGRAGAAELQELFLAFLGADRDQSVAGREDEPRARPVGPSRSALHRQDEHPGLGLHAELPQRLALRPASPPRRPSPRTSPRSPPAPSARPGAAARRARRTTSCRAPSRRRTRSRSRAAAARAAHRGCAPRAPRAGPTTPARRAGCRSAPRARRPRPRATGC